MNVIACRAITILIYYFYYVNGNALRYTCRDKSIMMHMHYITTSIAVTDNPSPYPNLDSSTPEWKAVVIIVPLAVGLDDLLHPAVVPCIKGEYLSAFD